MEPSALQASINRLPPHPPFDQLPPSDHPMLPLRKPRNHLVP